MSWFNLFGDVKELASEAIEDPDKRNQLAAKIDELQQVVYMKELDSKTIPWVDALHKMSRPLIAVVTIVVSGIVVSLHPNIDIMKLMTVLGGGGAPGLLYTAIKGKGK